MGLFNFFKQPAAPTAPPLIDGPYSNEALNRIYHLLFCDNLEWFRPNVQPPYAYPFDVLFSGDSTITGLQRLVDDADVEPRLEVLAYNRHPSRKELLAVIVEVGLNEGLDVLAPFSSGTARYINQTGKVLIWEESTDARATDLTNDLFSKSRQIIDQIGSWDRPRRPHPAQGHTCISFLVSDGLYFGEAPTDVLFDDPLWPNTHCLPQQSSCNTCRKSPRCKQTEIAKLGTASSVALPEARPYSHTLAK